MFVFVMVDAGYELGPYLALSPGIPTHVLYFQHGGLQGVRLFTWGSVF